MKVLVVGGGGREHTLVWKLNQSPRVDKIFCAPGNAGIGESAACLDTDAADIDGLVNFAEGEGIDLTVVGPEVPLAAGIVDKFEKRGLRIFGPAKEASELEASKVFSKRLMEKYSIPTARGKVYDDVDAALKGIDEIGLPLVVKADGLAAGKGVIVCKSQEEAEKAIHQTMVEKAFKEAGDRVVLEECLEGEEVSIIAFTDGEALLSMVPSQDHKPIFDDDRGPNTGGMGAYSPVPLMTEGLQKEITDTILLPTVKAMKAEGRPYKGVLYAGLMISNGKPKVLEFNVRFGDPETQVTLPRMKTDLVDVVEHILNGTLKDTTLEWREEACVCVVMVSKGYPGNYEKGKEITGFGEALRNENVTVFHAGTALKDGKVVTSGGRVLGVTALGKDIKAAIDNAYRGVEKINFEGAYCRSDIGKKALK